MCRAGPRNNLLVTIWTSILDQHSSHHLLL
jgi:hypothetical protein